MTNFITATSLRANCNILIILIFVLPIIGCATQKNTPEQQPPAQEITIQKKTEPRAKPTEKSEGKPEKAPQLADLMGMSPDLDIEAQKLYAKARVMWNAQEECSDPELAMEYLNVATSIEPEYADAYMRRAMAASQLGEWDMAFEDSSRAIRLDSKADNYALRSLIFMREGNYKGAGKDLERALKLDAKNSRAKEYLKKLNELQASAL